MIDFSRKNRRVLEYIAPYIVSKFYIKNNQDPYMVFFDKYFIFLGLIEMKFWTRMLLSLPRVILPPCFPFRTHDIRCLPPAFYHQNGEMHSI